MCVLFSTGCPRCNVLKQKLDSAGVEYEIVSDVARLEAEGIDYVPVLDIDGTRLEFAEAVKWANAQKGQAE